MNFRFLLVLSIVAVASFLNLSAVAEVLKGDAVRSDSESDGFGIFEMNDSVFSVIKGKSYKDNCRIPLEDLRYVTVRHFDIDGNEKKGELICNASIAHDLLDIFRNLHAARYPIERMELIDNFDADDIESMKANNTSCFNYREIAGSKKLSNHAMGMAIDINPLYNPYVKKRKDGSLFVSPEEGHPYTDRKGDYPYRIDEDDLCYKEFVAHGFTWGGSWQSLKDYQHFEK